jgi:hypothetical protein
VVVVQAVIRVVRVELAAVVMLQAATIQLMFLLALVP